MQVLFEVSVSVPEFNYRIPKSPRADAVLLELELEGVRQSDELSLYQ